MRFRRLWWSLGVAAALAAQVDRSRACAGCHREVWESYQRTGMGRSFALPSAANLAGLTAGNPYYHAPSESFFTMLERGGRYFQRRHQVEDGREVNVMEKPVDYVMGSGNHARTFLSRAPNGGLIELPLGWYAEQGGIWRMNPGYDRPDHDGFRRPVTFECMFCHNADPRPAARHDKPFADAVYPAELPLGIDCERCHGPGARHAEVAQSRGATPAQIRAAIVNPARLSASRQMEICLACHLESTSFPLPNAIQRYERGAFSFRPGEALSNFLLNFDHAPGTGHDDKFEIVNAGYRLRRSACFNRAQMTCTTCHNPHDVPRGEQAVRHYDATCRKCHAQVKAAGHAAGTRDCAGCHMPKRRTEDVIHVIATDHFIQRFKPAGDLLAAREERRETYRGPVALLYPPTLPPTAENELYLAVAQVKQKSNLRDGIPRLMSAITKHRPARAEWYFELAEALEAAGRGAEAERWYREAVRRDPASAPMQQRLGTSLRRNGRHAEAMEVMQRAAALDGARAMTWHELGVAYRAGGRSQEAVAALRKAIERDPDMPEAHNNLGTLLEARDAEAAFREAIRIRPDYADARYNLAMLLGQQRRYEEARRELETTARVNPAFVEARELLGDLLAGGGDLRGALVHYREVVRLRPDSARAHLTLGLALVAAGDAAGAKPHLEKAAAGSDAGIRQRALEALAARGQR